MHIVYEYAWSGKFFFTWVSDSLSLQLKSIYRTTQLELVIDEVSFLCNDTHQKQPPLKRKNSFYSFVSEKYELKVPEWDSRGWNIYPISRIGVWGFR